eukprot:scaffold11504_cov92-Isochrysis_galbana.AAC.3
MLPNPHRQAGSPGWGRGRAQGRGARHCAAPYFTSFHPASLPSPSPLRSLHPAFQFSFPAGQARRQRGARRLLGRRQGWRGCEGRATLPPLRRLGGKHQAHDAGAQQPNSSAERVPRALRDPHPPYLPQPKN